MKIQQVLVSLFVAMILSVRVLGEEKVNGNDVELEIKPANVSYELGSKIPVSFKIKNASQTALDIDFVFAIKGVTLPPKGWHPPVFGPISLKPGEEYKGEHSLNKYVRFPEPGEFEITYEGTIGKKDWAWNGPVADRGSGTAVKTGSFKLKIEKSAHPVEQVGEPIQFEIKPANTSYKLGEKIPIFLKIKDISQSTVNVVFEAATADASIGFSIKGSSPQRKSYPPGSYQPSLIKPGEEYKAEIDLSKFIKFPGPGEFEIIYSGTISYRLEKDPTSSEESEWQGVNGSGSFKLKIENPAKNN